MNSRERLLAALRHEPVDRVPVNITYYMAEFIASHFPDTGKERFEESLDRQLRFGFDPLVGLGGGGGCPWVVSDPGRWESREEREDVEIRLVIGDQDGGAAAGEVLQTVRLDLHS